MNFQSTLKSLMLCATIASNSVSPAMAVDSRPPATVPPGVGDPLPGTRPLPGSSVPGRLVTPQDKAKAEKGMERAYASYVAKLELAQDHFSDDMKSNDSLAMDLAYDQLYLAELEANAEFWSKMDYYSQIVGALAIANYSFKIGHAVATRSPVVQARVAGLVAMVAAIGTQAVARTIAEKKESYERLAVKQREIIDEQTKILLWQMDFGGQGQPAPSSDLDQLFAGCIMEQTCVDGLVCTTQSGVRDCEKQTKCEQRIRSCS